MSAWELRAEQDFTMDTFSNAQVTNTLRTLTYLGDRDLDWDDKDQEDAV